MTATTSTTHQIIRDNIHNCIHIQETKKGPRYCPSLEAKVTRFPHKSSHNVWLEPEGYDSDLIYPNGLSCSLPEDVQESMYRSVPGLENVKLVRPAYGVEYDHIDARELGPTLETKRIKVCLPPVDSHQTHSLTHPSGPIPRRSDQRHNRIRGSRRTRRRRRDQRGTVRPPPTAARHHARRGVHRSHD